MKKQAKDQTQSDDSQPTKIPVNVVEHEEDESETPDTHDIENDEEQIDPLVKECNEWKERAVRAMADYKNLEQRIAMEKKLTREQTVRNVAHAFMPFLDNLEQAEVFIKDPGLAMIKKQFIDALTAVGLEEVPLLGTAFDPYTAEAIDIVDGEENDIITAVMRRAFKYGDTVIRPGQVQVSRKQS